MKYRSSYRRRRAVMKLASALQRGRENKVFTLLFEGQKINQVLLLVQGQNE